MMKEKFVEYELENGEVKMIPAVEIEKIMESLGVNKYDAAYTYACDMGWEVDEEQEALVEATKGQKINHGAKSEQKKERKKVERKLDNVKIAMIAELAEFLTQAGYEEVRIENASKIVMFKGADGATYKFDLIRQRGKK